MMAPDVLVTQGTKASAATVLINFSRWRHKMETFSVLLAICAGNSPVNKGQWRGALMFSLICAWINGWVNNGEAGDLRRNRAYYDVTVMSRKIPMSAPEGITLRREQNIW